MTYAGLTPVVVTDPPFNIGYRYKGFTDRMDEGDYYAMLAEVTAQTAAVVIHYPEQLHRLSIEKGEAPERVVSWVYNSNTRKQHRDVAFYGVKPDFNRVKQPYKVYEWEDGEDKPTIYAFDDLSRKFGWDGYKEYGDTRYAADEYDEEFDFLGWHFRFWGDDTGGTPRYGATMSRDGETWECDYDCMFGAGFDDIH